MRVYMHLRLRKTASESPFPSLQAAFLCGGLPVSPARLWGSVFLYLISSHRLVQPSQIPIMLSGLYIALSKRFSTKIQQYALSHATLTANKM